MLFFISMCVKVSAMARDMASSIHILNSRISTTNVESTNVREESTRRLLAKFIKFHYGIVE